jgi:hypothetical protein
LAGDAGPANHDAFHQALIEALHRSAATERLCVDLTRLVFLSADCGTVLLHIPASFPEHRLIEIRCSEAQFRMLDQLGPIHDRRLKLVRAEH